jgi:hypothetical protein
MIAELGCCGVAVGLLSLAAWLSATAMRAGLPPLWQVLARPTAAISSLSPGPREIAGVVTAEKPVRSPLGASCAAARVDVTSRWTTGTSKHPQEHRDERTRLLVGGALRVRDTTGGCSLAEHDLELVGPSGRVSLTAGEFLGRFVGLADLVHPSAETVELLETRVPQGARVLVSGHAEEADAIVTGNYRRATRREHLLAPRRSRVLVSVGGQGTFVARALVPLCATLLISAWLAGYALALAWLLVALW